MHPVFFFFGKGLFGSERKEDWANKKSQNYEDEMGERAVYFLARLKEGTVFQLSVLIKDGEAKLSVSGNLIFHF